MSTNKKGQIDSAKATIREVFSQFWFRIPDYQRSYVWGKDELSELIDDVNYAAKHNPEGQYFLGSMVLRKVTRSEDGVSFAEHEILDGQQRLTTLMLLLAVIRDRIAKEKLKQTCREKLFQEENPYDNVPGRNRIVYQIRDNVGDFIKRFVKPDGATLSTDLARLSSSKNLSLANMAAGLSIIHRCLNDIERFENDAAIERFFTYLLNNTLFIYVATEDLDDAFRLFTILNNRGIPLSNSDILKAKNLGVITSEKERTKWAEFWEEIEGEMGRDEFDRFLSQVRTIYVKDKAREGLLKEFDERIYGAKPPLLILGSATFESIKTYKQAYDDTILLNSSSVYLGNEYRNRINVMRRGLPATDWIPPVLTWYYKFQAERLLELVQKVDNKFSADWICSLTPTQRINNMNEVLKAIERAKMPDEVFASSIFNVDQAQLKTLLDGEIYGRRFAKYVLLRVEHLVFNHTALLNLPDEISVEHILPQTPAANSQWNKDFTPTQQEVWRNRLGNLTLLSRRKNTSLGNLDFIDKKNSYFKDRTESLPNSQRVLTLMKFDFADLQDRQDDLLRRLHCSY